MSQCTLSIISGKKIWKVTSYVDPRGLESALNKLTNDGWTIDHTMLGSSNSSEWFHIISYKIEV